MIMHNPRRRPHLTADLHDQRFPRYSNSVTASDSSARPGKPIKDQSADRAPPIRLLLICHGEGLQHRYTGLGNVNSGLTARGWEEVETLATWLSTHEAIRALYSGPLLQSRLTAQRIGQSAGRPVTVLREPPQLTEYVFKPAQTNQEVAAAGAGANGSNAESPETAVEPVQDIFADYPEGTVALVASPDNIGTILRGLLAANDTRLEIDHTSLTGLRCVDERWSIAYVNRREHLPSPVLTPVEDKERTAKAAELEEDVASIVAVYNRVAREDVASKASDDREEFAACWISATCRRGCRYWTWAQGWACLPSCSPSRGRPP